MSVVSIDSAIWGRNVLALTATEPGEDLAVAEAAYVARHRPAYVSVKVPLEELSAIHAFESLGFEFVECQLRLLARFRQSYETTSYPYRYEEVASRDDLEDVLAIAGSTIIHDRFSRDPSVPAGFAGRRYRAYVEQSFDSAEEEVWRLYDPSRRATLGFRTLRRISSTEVLLLLGGIREDLKALGIGVISSHYCFNELRERGVRRAITHISAANRGVFDLEVGHFGFRYQQAYAVLRKLYH